MAQFASAAPGPGINLCNCKRNRDRLFPSTSIEIGSRRRLPIAAVTAEFATDQLAWETSAKQAAVERRKPFAVESAGTRAAVPPEPNFHPAAQSCPVIFRRGSGFESRFDVAVGNAAGT